MLRFNKKMAEKYKNKYRVASTRLQTWDYGANALYFVTICCQNRHCFFGHIANKKMTLSDIGKMAEKYWLEIPQHFPFVVLHNHVVMPNHVHGIIEIAKTDDGNGVVDVDGVETQNFAFLLSDATQKPTDTTQIPLESTQKMQQSNKNKNKFGPQSKNLASIIRGFKIGVTKNARQYQKTQNKVSISFSWQPRYHDHIIRNHKAYQNISNYIINNPNNWKEDTFYTIY